METLLTTSSGGWSWDGGAFMQPYRDALTNPDYFGETGIVDREIQPVNLVTIDSSSLGSIDGFISTWWSDSQSGPFASEIVDFFLAGGDLILLQDDSSHDQIGELLGLPTSSSNGSVSNGGAPLFDGVFGTATNVEQRFAVGQLSAADVSSTNGTVGGTNASGQITSAFWDDGDYAPGAGKLLIIPDIDMWSSFSATYDPLNDNGIFALNGTAFIVEKDKERVPEPSSILGLFLLMGLSFYSLLKRRSQSSGRPCP